MKPKILTTACRRCGKPLATLNKSLCGLDELKARLDRICTDCITSEETQEILNAQAKVILSKERRKDGIY